MIESVSALLERRAAAPLDGSFRRAVAAAAVLHLLTVLAAWALPRWLEPAPPPLEYVAVTIVPAARLGVEPPKPPSPKPAPEPKKIEPEPAPKSESAPVLPVATPKKEEPKPAPRAAEPQRESAAAAATPEEQGIAGGALSGLALGAPVARLDNPDFTYGYYVDQMLALISRNWVRPPVGGGIEVWVHYRIERDGKVTGIEIIRSSGINSFDLAALRAVQSSSPLPPLPRAYRESSLGVNLIVR
ncbi:MAG TPA: TonB family protein [Thermoanaerobaculia bacterium]